MRYDWDPAKDAANIAKHGIAFIRAVEAFDDPRRLDDDSTRAEFGEARRHSSGGLDRPGRQAPDRPAGIGE